MSHGLTRFFRRALQGMKAKHAFARDLQGFSAGREHAESWRALKEAIGHFRRFFDQMLATVQDEESFPVVQIAEQCIFQIDTLRNEPNRGGYGADNMLLISHH